ncbi:MAG TPA: hypothetical protein VGF52_06715 [Tepidisphaeraceae bacterium]
MRGSCEHNPAGEESPLSFRPGEQQQHCSAEQRQQRQYDDAALQPGRYSKVYHHCEPPR